MSRALAVPGVVPVLFVTLVFVLAHTILYTYIATFLAHLGMADSTDLVLLVFGAASLVSIWIVGAHIQRRLRALLLTGTVLVAVAAALLQTAVSDAGGDSADAALAMLVTLWNVAMAGGGVGGGLLLGLAGSSSFPWAVLVLLVPVLAAVIGSRTHGFPARRAVAT
jgi:predicted MFS family arabinose efflux permease